MCYFTNTLVSLLHARVHFKPLSIVSFSITFICIFFGHWTLHFFNLFYVNKFHSLNWCICRECTLHLTIFGCIYLHRNRIKVVKVKLFPQLQVFVSSKKMLEIASHMLMWRLRNTLFSKIFSSHFDL